MFDWFGELIASVAAWLLEGILALVAALLSTVGIDWEVLTLDWSYIEGLEEGLLWLFPVGECVTMLFAAYALTGSIRLGRWGLALVPTVGG